MDELLARQTRCRSSKVDDGMRGRARPHLPDPAEEGDDHLRRQAAARPTRRRRAASACRSITSSARWRRTPARRAVAIVLSGAGSDGSRGIREIHEAGGLVICQTPETARISRHAAVGAAIERGRSRSSARADAAGARAPRRAIRRRRSRRPSERPSAALGGDGRHPAAPARRVRHRLRALQADDGRRGGSSGALALDQPLDLGDYAQHAAPAIPTSSTRSTAIC